MGLFGSLFGGSAAKKQSALGLRLATLDEKYAQHAGLKAQIESLVETGRLGEFEALWNAAWASKEFTAFGERLYDLELRWVVALDEETIENPAGFLNAFSAQFAQTPTAFWGGMYALALQAIADDIRGGNWAHQVTDSAWLASGNIHGRVAEILGATAGTAAGSFPWARAAYAHALEHADADAFAAQWEQLYALDAANLSALSDHAIHLLPRWRGVGPADAENFARQATNTVTDVFGSGAYAGIVGGFANIGELDIDDTAVDATLLRQSYQDLLARFPGSVVLLNAFANGMSWANDEAAVWAAYESFGLRAIDPFTWGGDDEDEGMEYAVDAISYARDNH